jgi:DNA-binding NtrC family response regulator
MVSLSGVENNEHEVASLLGMIRRALYNKISKYDINTSKLLL